MRGMYARKRKTRRNQLGKIPVIGPILQNIIGFAPQALFGAIMVEPTMMLAKAAGRYVPALPAPLFYALAGLLVAAVINSKYIPLNAALKNKLAIAAASAAGGVAYYKFRTSGGAPETMASETGMLELRGYSGPLGLLGNHGSLQLRPGPLNGYGQYGEYGPSSVRPLGRY
jgi:hypothetical protein